MRKFTVTFDTPIHVALYIVVTASSFDDAVARAQSILEQDIQNMFGYEPIEVILHFASDSIPESHATTKRPKKRKKSAE